MPLGGSASLHMNVFSKNDKGTRPPSEAPPRRRGRPRGTTEQGVATRQQLYDVAIELVAKRGYEATTLRDVATEAGVSVGLLYRYFPSKSAVVLALYDDLSSTFTTRAGRVRAELWRDRFVRTLELSLEVLGAQRTAIAALAPILVGDPERGLFSASNAASREKVEAVFARVVTGSTDAPSDPDDAAALGRLLYLAHLAVILFWLLDRTAKQRATRGLLGLLRQSLPFATAVIGLDSVRAIYRRVDRLSREALFGEDVRDASISGSGSRAR